MKTSNHTAPPPDATEYSGDECSPVMFFLILIGVIAFLLWDSVVRFLRGLFVRNEPPPPQYANPRWTIQDPPAPPRVLSWHWECNSMFLRGRPVTGVRLGPQDTVIHISRHECPHCRSIAEYCGD